jgi:hypothetical protein
MKKAIGIALLLLPSFSMAQLKIHNCQDHFYPAEVYRCQISELEKLEQEIQSYIATIEKTPQVYGKELSSSIRTAYQKESREALEVCVDNRPLCRYRQLFPFAVLYESTVTQIKEAYTRELLNRIPVYNSNKEHGS